jgi:ABC-type glycerol-3-phosphate transport system substrate-binding protein
VTRKSIFIKAGAVLAALALALTGCSGESDPGTTDDSTGPETTEPITLTFQSLSDQPATIAAVEGIVAEWNAANPNIQVEIVSAGWDSVYDKLITQLNSGTAPDIIHYEAASIVSFAADGYLADLTDVMSAERQADIPAGVLDSVTVDGQVVAYPTELQTYMAFANKAIFDAAGVEVPSGDTMTWETFREVAKATTSDGVYGLGWGLKSPTASFMSLALGYGGTFFDGTGANATIHVTDAELAVPEHVYQMAYEDMSLMPVTLTQSGGEALAAFYAGQTAMTVQGSYQAANMTVDAPEDVDWVVLPPIEGSVGAGQSASPQTLSISIDSPYIAEAAQFLEFFTNADNLTAVCEADALIPATTPAQQAMTTKLAAEPGWDVILASGQYLEAAPFMFTNSYQAWKDTVATPAFQKYLAGAIDKASLSSELTNGWATVNG